MSTYDASPFLGEAGRPAGAPSTLGSGVSRGKPEAFRISDSPDRGEIRQIQPYLTKDFFRLAKQSFSLTQSHNAAHLAPTS